MEINNKKLTQKIFLKVAIGAISVVAVIILASYLIIHRYINKMNLVTSEDDITNEQMECGSEEAAELASSLEADYKLEAVDIADSLEDEISHLEEKIRNNMEENQTPIMQDDEVFNILLIGSDTRKPENRGRSDAMIVVSINKKTKTITATSILRDIYLKIPGKNNNRINAAYVYGGAELLMETIEQNFRLKVDRYASVDFYVFIDIIDALGGVTLDVTEKEIKVINNFVAEFNRRTDQEETFDQLTEPGIILLNGKQALAYARNRSVGNNDFERTARQRRVLEQIFLKVKDIGLLELSNLMNKLLPQVITNLTEGEIFSLILSLPSYAMYDLQQWSIPVNGSYSHLRIRGMSVLGIDFDENIREIEKRIFGIEE
ncbi:MAG: LCP family protein [Clostridiales bacterium]|nr:LCP family protein [Clostridiales bacterium]